MSSSVPGEVGSVGRVVVAMSGGVDSSVAAARLVRAGHDVVGVTLHLWDYPDDGSVRGRCCAPEDQYNARRTADAPGIPHFSFDGRDLFRRDVVDPFVGAYLDGTTPSPCVSCNKTVKLPEQILAVADRLGASFIATGHYARIARDALVVAGVTGKLFAIGGIRNGRFLEHNTVYDPESDKWAARAPMPSQRAGAAAVVINGSIFVFGGRGPVGDEARRVEVYDTENDVWTAKAQMPTRHDYAATTIIDGKVYVVGGHNRGAVDRYDPETDSWSVAGWLKRPLIYSRSSELSGSFIIVGGFDGSDYLATVLSFSPPQSPGVVRALCPETDV